MTSSSTVTNRSRSRGIVIAVDVVLINVAFWLSYLVRYQLGIPYEVDEQFYTEFVTFLPYAALVTVLCLLTYYIDGLYEYRRRRRLTSQIYRITSATLTSIVITMATTFFLQPLFYSRGMLILAGGIIIVFLIAARITRRMIESMLRRRGIGVDRLLVVGAGDVGRAVMRSVIGDPGLGYQLVGYVDDDPDKGQGRLGRIVGLGEVEDTGEIIDQRNIDEVIVTLPWMYHRKIMQIVEACERENVRVRVVPDVFQQRMHHVDLESLNGIPLIGSGPVHMSRSASLIKRVIDLLIGLLILPLVGLLFAVVAIAIKIDSKGPIIYRQRRVGKDGREFDVLKFRSMIVGADDMKADLAHLNEVEGPIFKIKDDPRLTRVGRLLRRTSIDEFPQFINVLRGEMSVVGPRPSTPEEFENFEPWMRKRTGVRPGITGLWQVSGRSDIPFAEMILLDIFYIENWSLDLEIRILLQTIPRVLFGSGAY